MTAETMTEQRSLHRKLAEVMAEAERIPKNGTAPASMGGFPFVQVGDAADAIRTALAKRNVSMLPTAMEPVGEAEHTTSSGKVMTTYTVRVTWTLTDGDSGESAVIQSLGTGGDMGDKFAPKAQTNAMKYALLMGFLLSTGDDPEMTDTSDRQRRTRTNRPPQTQAAAESDEPVSLGVVTFVNATPTVGTKAPADGELRETTEGKAIVFGLQVDAERSIPQVVAKGGLAEALFTAAGGPGLPKIVKEPVSVSGELWSVPWRKDGRKMRPFQRLVLHRIETREWSIPGPAAVPADEPAACPSTSPYGDSAPCVLPAGHDGHHKNGASETWAA